MLPVVARAEGCSLCGFCVQVCPTYALRIHEDVQETRLVLDPVACTGCGKCVRTCDPRALRKRPLDPPILGGGSGEGESSPQNWGGRGAVLRRSPRAVCPACGEPTVSQAELAYVAAQLGDHPAWLDYCLACRPEYVGG